MYMRLWWKDARQFWSIWVFVALAAAAGQWAALNYYGPDVRQGPLLSRWPWCGRSCTRSRRGRPHSRASVRRAR